MDNISHTINTFGNYGNGKEVKRCDFCNNEVTKFFPFYDGACDSRCANNLMQLRGEDKKPFKRSQSFKKDIRSNRIKK